MFSLENAQQSVQLPRSVQVQIMTPDEVRGEYLQRFASAAPQVDEYIQLGLADHPDFVGMMKAAILTTDQEDPSLVRSRLIANRLLDQARRASQQPSHAVIAGRRCGVQSCTSQEANVFVEIAGGITYIRLDRQARKAVEPFYKNPAFGFVQQHYDDFDALCDKVAFLGKADKSRAEVNAGRKNADSAQEPHQKVEFDLNYYGGDYSGVGRFAYIPESAIEQHGSVAAAFSAVTGYSAQHIVCTYDDERYSATGEEWRDGVDVAPTPPRINAMNMGAPELLVSTIAGESLRLHPVAMNRMPSHLPSDWLAFLKKHIPGTSLDEESQERMQRFMRKHQTECLTDGRRHITLAGGMLAECDPASFQPTQSEAAAIKKTLHSKSCRL